MLDPDYRHWSPAAVETPDNPDRMTPAELAAHVATLAPDPQAAYLWPDPAWARLATRHLPMPRSDAPPSAWFLAIEKARGGTRCTPPMNVC